MPYSHLQTLAPISEDTPEAELAKRAAGGEEAAFEAIMRRHNRLLFRTARSILKSDAEVEDALQEAYLRAWRALGDFRSDARLSTWLVRIVINEALGRLRKKEAQIIPLDAAMTSLEPEMQTSLTADFERQPERIAMRTELRKLMEARIDMLPEVFRTVFMLRAVQEMSGYFTAEIERRKKHPTDDLISTLMNARDKDGQPLSDMHVLGSLRLLLIAGIDTTWSAIGSSLWHLARTPADRARLVAEPQLMPTAVEELLRAYSPVTMAREVMKETVISGCPVKPGNMVLLSFPAANRDPAMFPDADKVVIDRKENRHAAFGLGIHRCVGSNLARMEMTVAIEEWLKRIPDFRLDPAGRVTWSEGTVRGPRQLPILFGTAG